MQRATPGDGISVVARGQAKGATRHEAALYARRHSTGGVRDEGRQAQGLPCLIHRGCQKSEEHTGSWSETERFDRGQWWQAGRLGK